MVRFLHTSDLHLDRPFVWLGEKGKERRRALRRLLERICTRAKDDEYNFLVIVGDLFEQYYVTPDTINFIKQQLLSVAPKQVFIAPGNHDPCVPDSPYLTEQWPENVHLFKSNSFSVVHLPEFNTSIHGIANTSFQDDSRYLEGYKVPEDEATHIILFHGSDMGTLPSAFEKEAWFPFEESEIFASKADYVALGHYHSYRTIPSEAPSPMACYPGCPEALDLPDVGQKYVLDVQINTDNNRVTPISLSEYWHDEVTVNCDGMATREDIVSQLRTLAKERNWGKAVVKTLLKGEPDPGLELNLDEIKDSVDDLIFALELADETEFPYDLEQLAQRRDALGEFVKRLKAEIESNKHDDDKTEVLNLAALLGLDAFLRNEVRKP